MSRNSRRRTPARRDQRGAVAVEFALVLPLLIMLLMGTITGGLAYFQKISLADATREGARFGATADAAIAGWAGVVQDRTVDAAPTVLDPAAPGVCVQLLDASGGVEEEEGCGGSPLPPPPAPPASLGAGCVVRVWATKHTDFSIGLQDWPIDLVQDAYARYERTCP